MLCCVKPWGHVPSDPDTSTLHHTATHADLISDILIDICVHATSNTLTPCSWLTFFGPYALYPMPSVLGGNQPVVGEMAQH